MDGRVRRACSPYEAWGAGERSRFAELASNCLKDSQTNAMIETTCFVWQVRTTVRSHRKNLTFLDFLNANGCGVMIHPP